MNRKHVGIYSPEVPSFGAIGFGTCVNQGCRNARNTKEAPLQSILGNSCLFDVIISAAYASRLFELFVAYTPKQFPKPLRNLQIQISRLA